MIIIGQSALDWWRTPPGIKSAPLTPGMMLNYSTSVYDNHRRVMHQRKNACGPARLIGNRLFSDLKGVQLPVQVLVPHESLLPVPSYDSCKDCGKGAFHRLAGERGTCRTSIFRSHCLLRYLRRKGLVSQRCRRCFSRFPILDSVHRKKRRVLWHV